MSESNVSLSPRARKEEIAACPQSRLDKPPARLRCFVALQEGGRQGAGCSEKGTGMVTSVTSESSAPAVASHKSEEVPPPGRSGEPLVALRRPEGGTGAAVLPSHLVTLASADVPHRRLNQVIKKSNCDAEAQTASLCAGPGSDR
ncbi:uncharacterized protein PGTG_10981 [Puccinia graminis f. sp. tritici CRL 75-36-700-3]|uniref:Uncharacterized protein n=1 Tax=Puccinia graminis f. sp. tritici (strain CRL 75-36-700-3 / race SCCL) TaxID=418459 RepID=E3KN16_PUCGT|nr:uncharacterized protein PGTG_10981 [Puccinia graminis f. sp. tritici CRL 75-36-700-3]EFP85652.1 hypothetical protein PGTG_10981 [Puccinia graminis f. sp. tritici CRL 75-36-700-3]